MAFFLIFEELHDTLLYIKYIYQRYYILLYKEGIIKFYLVFSINKMTYLIALLFF